MQFVVLHHTGWPGRTDHYDLMLQFAAGDNDDVRVLRTFATTENQFPTGEPVTKLQRIEDHRRAYLKFEGPLSGNRGRIARMDSGEVSYGPADELELRGTTLMGRFRLIEADGIYMFQKLA